MYIQAICKQCRTVGNWVCPNCHSKESSSSPTGYDEPISVDEYIALERRVDELWDALNNGIRHDKDRNVYVLIWTKKQIDDAKQKADEMMLSLSRDNGAS